MTIESLRRIRWAVRGTFALGVAASVAANILHARPNPIAQIIAAWPPLALLITVELVSHVPVHRRTLGVVRILATTAIAGIAAFISYTHMAEVVARFGEVDAAPYLLPLSVDGLVVAASVSLVELSGRIRDSSNVAAVNWASAVDGVPAVEPTNHSAVEISSTPRRDGNQALSAVLDTNATFAVDSKAHRTSRRPRGSASSVRKTSKSASQLGTIETASEEAVNSESPELLATARAARDALIREGRSAGRDAVAARLRQQGHAIRNTRVSKILGVIDGEFDRKPWLRPVGV